MNGFLPSKQHTYFKLWWQAIRPRTLLVSIAPVLLGQFLVWQAFDSNPGVVEQASVSEFSWWLALLCIFCALMLQIAVNLANDYFDYYSGVDGANRVGPKRVTQRNLIDPKKVKQGFIFFLLLGIFLGLVILLTSSIQLLWLGILCVLAVLTYTSGPYPLAYNALGECIVFWIFGPIAVIGSYYAQYQTMDVWLWLPACQMGFLAAAIMLTNNIRDYSSDAAAGKRTVVFYMGVSNGRFAYQFMIILSVVCAIAYSVIRYEIALLTLLLLPGGIILCRSIGRRDGTELNRQLGQTAQFMLGSSIFLILDLMLIKRWLL